MEQNSLLVYELEDLEKEPFGFDIKDLDKYQWRTISSFSELSEHFIRKYHDKLDWDELIGSGVLTDSLIREFSSKFFHRQTQWDKIAMEYKLSKETLIEFYDKFTPDVLIENQKLPARVVFRLLREYRYPIAPKIIEYQTFTSYIHKAFLKAKMEESIDWYAISKSKKLTKKTMRDFKTELAWDVISMYQDLSDDTMLEFRDYINWDIASEYQDITKKIILEVPQKINIERLKQNKKINWEEFDDQELLMLLEMTR